jgi:hypothetical protein
LFIFSRPWLAVPWRESTQINPVGPKIKPKTDRFRPKNEFNS